MRGWVQAGPAAAGWTSPPPVEVASHYLLDFPWSAANRVAPNLSRECYKRITSYGRCSTKSRAPGKLKQRHLNAQELLGVLPEISDEQSHVTGQPSQVVVKLGIGKQLSRRRRIVVQLRG